MTVGMATNRASRGTAEPRFRQREIAERCGVSASTVSRVLNNAGVIGDEVRRRVRAAAAELGYWETLPHEPGLLRHTGLLITKPPAQPFLNPFYAAICTGVGAYKEAHALPSY